MNVTIYHNPSCSNSRGALAILREAGHEPQVIEYLKTPLNKAQLAALVKKMGVAVKDVVRWKQAAEVTAAGISEASSDDELLEAMAQRPVLMNRPIVVVASDSVAPRARLCRPPEIVRELL